ncbi:MAG: hypothetical protein N3A66_04845, partial [Planctomycetota bacterium]|nr:hypothetical protein [Planctomycetota bacterium]
VESAKHLLDAEEIASLKPGCVLVNIGRSMLINMPALVKRLRQNDLIAMLDVFDQEPLPKDSVLRTLPNVYLTPHRAGGLVESVVRAFDMLISDLEAALAGRKRRYAVTEKTIVCLPG